jgi:hypothetical protein
MVSHPYRARGRGCHRRLPADSEAANQEATVVLSYDFWMRHYNGDRDVLCMALGAQRPSRRTPDLPYPQQDPYALDSKPLLEPAHPCHGRRALYPLRWLRLHHPGPARCLHRSHASNSLRATAPIVARWFSIPFSPLTPGYFVSNIPVSRHDSANRATSIGWSTATLGRKVANLDTWQTDS